MSGSFGDKFLYFLSGAGVGGAIALLFAPQSGRDTRDELSKRALEGREFVDGKVEESRRFVEERGRRVSNEMTALVDRGKGDFDGLVEKGKDVFEKQKGQFSAAFEAGKEAYLQDRDATD